MPLQRIKFTVATGWVVATLVIGVIIQVTSLGGQVVLAAFGLLPPLGLLLLWNEPRQTMSESIREGRR